MKPETKELKRFVRQMPNQSVIARFKKENFEIAVSLAIQHRSGQERAAGMLVDSVLLAGWREILQASQDGRHVVIE